eukprot:CAMPEP_0172575578 /NCGR_PEP_ID=MMETSP1067-20121228/137283_1 /TAXON_ID=265564 ORGANISM="Thalassiosira punctigera, Strain Tpunct2005C2" /NCGR_SAMPLE_ID=MMETSP1067 /ASSEMBLY_ACC=CAM_ASM_000444 /LENGTH=381 /DNA_ID=CAMNT_0013368229 /DNA_START=40 /DNA_END=1185 /DNA_ORIENTATION=+
MVPKTDHASRPYDAIYPRQYIAYRAPLTIAPDSSSQSVSPAVTIDGNLDKPFWNDVGWSEDFVDIATETPPKFRTRVKMRWDDEFLYVGAYMQETDVWGTLTEHNSVIYHDNDFEVFVDTDGTNHNYKEFEINAHGTTWSLLLNKPYDDGGGENSKREDPNGYDMEPPLQSATKVYPNDAINQPGITNTHWTTEIALPLSKLMERNPLAKNPAGGVFWRVNFSRVQWGFNLNANGQYEKDPCCQSCATPGSAAEDNWVWTKQGEVAMHLPERWGIVQFESELGSARAFYEEWPSRCAAMAIYYAMKGYHEKEGMYTTDIEALKPFSKPPFPISEEAFMLINLKAEGYEAKATIASFTATVNEERYLVVSTQKCSTSQTKCE